MKRITRFLAITVTAVALAQSASAQMMGGGYRGGGTGSGGYGGGMGSGGMGGGMGGGWTGDCSWMGSGMGMGYGMGYGMGMGCGVMGAGIPLLVGSNGTMFAVSGLLGSSTGSAPTAGLVAIGPDGRRAWAWSANGPVSDTMLASDLVIVSIGTWNIANSSLGSAGQGAIVALRAASGAEAWRATLDGFPMRLDVGPSGVLTQIAKVTTWGSGNSSSYSFGRAVVAIDLTGHVLWSASLD